MMPLGIRIFVWNLVWRPEVEHYAEVYLYLKARLFVWDRNCAVRRVVCPPSSGTSG